MKKKLQVFVSSTYLDLKDERQAAVSAILKAGHIPAGMELFTAGDKSQLEIIKRWIDESDVYMLILGGRYGSVQTETGVGYTELEYDYAVQIGKPLFAIVIKDNALEEKVKSIGSSVLEKERQTELRLFREKVLSKMSSFFEDEKDIRLAVMESLSDISSTRDLSGWISGNEVPDIKGLIDEINKLNNEITQLKNENELLQKKSNFNPSTEEEFEKLITILKNIEINIPPNIIKEENGIKRNLYQLLLISKDFLVTGITNQINQDDSIYFYYNNICPKLQIHDLVKNEKVPSVRYRRFSITEKGQKLLAYIDKKNILKKSSI
ncbi:DUF4062 domain-containing protein [Aliarcobacter butzleri]|uniref:DUF4062 domain-containing protein n=1 Tax=Aliarcobacter butzleri TaxID=28197 RepID=A0AAW6VH06_9BACT|nr:DUF4062 domain-containing protein [Aliarcobacter butzleri]MDK2041817.1 DUF4062 domain-containing protein [Aliarcobacter butzleri]MDK2097195.1 DUF4062 domain-containing protein [Aliarcobacter butzleri]